MPLQQKTTKEIDDNIIAQLESELNQTIPLLQRAFNRVLSKVLSGLWVILYKYCGFIFLQLFVRYASNEPTIINGKTVIPLQEIGDLIGIGLPVPATQAELLIDITVTNQIGTLSSGTALIGIINGVTYLTIGAVTLDAPTKQVTVRAEQDQAGGGGAGAIGNLNPGDEMNFANPIANVGNPAVVNVQTVTGANGESTEAYRQRIIDRFQKLPQGGATADYEQWGEEAAGIINVYPYTGNEPGEVDMFSEATVASSGNDDGIPTAAQLQAVLDSVELDQDGLPSRRPANAFPNSFAITRTGFNIDIEGIVDVNDLATVESDIDSALVEFFKEFEPFIDGLTPAPRRDVISQSAIIGLVEDIVTNANGTFTTATFEEAASPGAIEKYPLDRGEKSKSEAITFS